VIDKLSDRDELMPSLMKLDKQKVQILLGFVTQWNTNSRTSLASQSVLNCLLKIMPPEELLELPNIRSTIESLIPYTRSRMTDDLPMESIDDMPDLIDVDLPAQLPSLIEQNTIEPAKQADEFRIVSKRKRKSTTRDVEMEESGSAEAAVEETGNSEEASPRRTKRSKGEKGEMRKIPVPKHRYTPLKDNWVNIFTPIVKNLGLQISDE
ncbi:Utp13 specific WD40 associated domain protein, partial [Teladorsagia circumcincta]